MRPRLRTLLSASALLPAALALSFGLLPSRAQPDQCVPLYPVGCPLTPNGSRVPAVFDDPSAGHLWWITLDEPQLLVVSLSWPNASVPIDLAASVYGPDDDLVAGLEISGGRTASARALYLQPGRYAIVVQASRGESTETPYYISAYGLAGHPGAPGPDAVDDLQVAAVSAGGSHTVALGQDGRVWAWGRNDFGQLGEGTITFRLIPVEVGGLPPIAAVAAGLNHSLAVGQDGSLWAWGQNSLGQLGDGTTSLRPSPARVAGLPPISAGAAGRYHSLALGQDGSLWAWGSNSFGQLGDGTTTASPSPARVAGLPPISAVAAGESHSLALGQDGSLWAWGQNSLGQLGDGTTASDSPSPARVAGLPPIAAVAAGNAHSLAVGQDGSLWAWGYNLYGQLGDGTTSTRLSPTRVAGLPPISAVAAGFSYSLAVGQDGSLWAWGRNDSGQLGDGTTSDRFAPVRVIHARGG